MGYIPTRCHDAYSIFIARCYATIKARRSETIIRDLDEIKTIKFIKPKIKTLLQSTTIKSYCNNYSQTLQFRFSKTKYDSFYTFIYRVPTQILANDRSYHTSSHTITDSSGTIWSLVYWCYTELTLVRLPHLPAREKCAYDRQTCGWQE